MLNTLLNDARFARLIEQQAVDGTAAYTAAELLATVRKGVWKELDGAPVKIDAYRRNLQNAYLEIVNTKLNPAPAGAAAAQQGGGGGRGGGGRGGAKSEDEKPFYRAELRALTASINAAIAKADGSRYQGAFGRREGPDREDSGSQVPGAGERKCRRWAWRQRRV